MGTEQGRIKGACKLCLDRAKRSAASVASSRRPVLFVEKKTRAVGVDGYCDVPPCFPCTLFLGAQSLGLFGQASLGPMPGSKILEGGPILSSHVCRLSITQLSSI
ncbi:unnamed protein product [Urochloa decumbens]|uniref:Uncharacterized protein n=1 Tax=Urochloa decumbens TaxID=240449 RepID=A0ABC8Y3M9_9POAL